MTQKELQTNFNIPEEAIQLVKSVTKISNDELGCQMEIDLTSGKKCLMPNSMMADSKYVSTKTKCTLREVP